MSEDKKIRAENVLELRELCKSFPRKRRWQDFLEGRARGELLAVDRISFRLRRAETMGLVGESGCGKSTLARTILRLYEPSSGSIFLEGREIGGLSQKELRPLRRQMQMVFQDPYASLNPRMTVYETIAEMLRFHGMAERAEMESKVYQLLEFCGLSRDMAKRFPREFSGGQRQRVGIARALSLNPSLVVADEPLSALDVSIQAQMINLLRSLQRELELTLLFITHDISVLRYISHRVLVMYLGMAVETGPTEELFSASRHPYTQILIRSAPIPDPSCRCEESLIEGDLPSPLHRPSGCAFHTRCPFARERCREEQPQPVEVAPEHFCACHNPLK